MATKNVILYNELQANIDLGYQNLVDIVNLGTLAEKSDGLKWYGIALYGAFYLSELYDFSVHSAIDVVACLSPQLRWSDNLLAAESVIRYYRSGAFVPQYEDYLSGKYKLVELGRMIDLPIAANVTGANKVKALWLLQGHYEALSGPKVSSFADNIYRLFDSAKVTVDSHAINAWLGFYGRRSVALGAPSFYKIIEADYIRLAEWLGISPLEAQAIVWVILRRLSGSDTGDKVIPERFIPSQAQLERMYRILGIVFQNAKVEESAV